MKKAICVVSVLLILFLLLSNIIIGWPFIQWYNDSLVNKFQKSLVSSIENKDKVINSFNQFGNLTGSSNHCDCNIAVLVESKMSFDEFVEYYTNNTFSFNIPFSEEVFLDLYQVKNNKIFVIDEGVGNNGYEVLPDKMSKNKSFYTQMKNMVESSAKDKSLNYYVISISDQTFSGINMLDIRCN